MAEPRLLLRMEQIDKTFPGVHALDHVDFDLYEGEVHILLGENGAGKSTLVKILSGSLPRDSGRIYINGGETHDLDPELSQALGIGMVYQELSLLPNLSVAENIFIGRPPRNRFGIVDWGDMHERARSSLASLGLEIDPRSLVRELGVAEQQLTEIAKVITKRVRILLLDEPTSALSDGERERLFALIRRLQKQGVGIIHISHRLAEVEMIGQRVTVMRDGRVIGTLPVREASQDQLINMMVGRRLAEQYPKTQAKIGAPVMRVDHLRMVGVLEDISFEVRHGEILGIFGLMGAGQVELARALFGLLPINGGKITIDSDEIKIERPAQAIKHGLGLLTRDRREGLVPMLPIPANITLANLSQSPLYRRMRLETESQIASTYIQDLDIVPADTNRPVMYLSGGNQQKVVLARWLFSKSKVLIFDEPTRGIDVGAKAEVFALMNELTQRGTGIIMISSEMPEILAMADRILVMRSGQITAEFQAGTASQEKLLISASLTHGGSIEQAG